MNFNSVFYVNKLNTENGDAFVVVDKFSYAVKCLPQ